MKHIQALICLAAIICCFASCKKEDDISELFEGRKLYMTEVRIQGSNIVGEDLKTIYHSEDAYYIQFGKETFTGSLANGATFNGTWEADGKKHTFQLSIRQTPSTSQHVDRLILNTLNKVIRYEGDSNIIRLIADDANVVTISARRSPESSL
jgi:hypothetical protein